MKFTIVYASPHGQTRKIATMIATKLKAKGKDHEAELIEISDQNARQPLKLETDVIILGAPIYMGRYPKPLIRWAHLNHELLRDKIFACFNVSLNRADQRPEARRADERILRQLIQEIRNTPEFVASFAGALKYTEYGWLQRQVMKWISRSAGGPIDTSCDHELTDWNEVEAFVDAVSGKESSSRFSTSARLT